MQLSLPAELGIRACTLLAERYGERPVRLSDICECRGCKKDTLVKVMKDLARADLVRPVRGNQGGYLLRKEPSEITLLDIIEAIEGPQALNRCQHFPSDCDQSKTCKVQLVWKRIQENYVRELAAVTLADLQ